MNPLRSPKKRQGIFYSYWHGMSSPTKNRARPGVQIFPPFSPAEGGGERYYTRFRPNKARPAGEQSLESQTCRCFFIEDILAIAPISMPEPAKASATQYQISQKSTRLAEMVLIHATEEPSSIFARL